MLLVTRILFAACAAAALKERKMLFKLMLGKGALPVLRRVAAFTESRHVLIANNIANVNTPFYEAKDLDAKGFQTELRRALDRRARGNPRIFEMDDGRNFRQQLNDVIEHRVVDGEGVGMLRHSRNNVSIDIEMAKLSANGILHNTAEAMLRHQYGLIEDAIRERIA